MLIKTLPVGMLDTNCYVITDEKTLKCAIIDPGADSNTILDYIESNHLVPEVIFLTHGHFDHHIALGTVMESTGAMAYINKKDATTDGWHEQLKLADDGHMNWYGEGDIIKIGGLIFQIMETPGHSPGSVTILCENALFTGDTLFRDSCGRTDLDGSSPDALMDSLRRLASLHGDYEVYPGHADSSTLNRERAFNYYMRQALGQQHNEQK